MSYYIAKYPAILQKLHRKIKILEKHKVMHKMIPLYLMGYIVFKYLGYHTDWIIIALSEVVGKSVPISPNASGLFTTEEGQSDSVTNPSPVVAPTALSARPDAFSRFLLYKFLMRYQEFQAEAWLKNIEGVDVAECLKDTEPSAILDNNEPRGGLSGGLGGGLVGGFNPMMLEMMDDEAQMKAIE